MITTGTWTVEIHLFESDDATSARATLVSGSGASRRRTLSGTGYSTLNPADVAVPEIGDEVAVARALRHLSDQLLATASDDIEAVQQREAHLTH